jgi:cytochrome bd-type quinol oxidase subunit 1
MNDFFARLQIAMSPASHIVSAALGIGMPLGKISCLLFPLFIS